MCVPVVYVYLCVCKFVCGMRACAYACVCVCIYVCARLWESVCSYCVGIVRKNCVMSFFAEGYFPPNLFWGRCITYLCNMSNHLMPQRVTEEDLRLECPTCARDFSSYASLHGHFSVCPRGYRKPASKRIRRPKYYKNLKMKPAVLQPGDVDMQKHFDLYDRRIFNGVLASNVIVTWESFNPNAAYRNTLGVTWNRHTNSRCPIRIQLNRNLLRDRTLKQKKSVLVHEMIHAYLMQIREDDDHGPNFIKWMGIANGMFPRLGVELEY